MNFSAVRLDSGDQGGTIPELGQLNTECMLTSRTLSQADPRVRKFVCSPAERHSLDQSTFGPQPPEPSNDSSLRTCVGVVGDAA